MRRSTFVRGFSLIEIVISVGVLGAIVAIYAATSGTVFLSRDVRYQDIATKIAGHKLEELRATPYANLPASGTFTDTLLSQLPNGTASTTISTYNTHMKRVDVGVSWQLQGKPLRQVSLSTLVTDTGGL